MFNKQYIGQDIGWKDHLLKEPMLLKTVLFAFTCSFSH